jgi:type VI secretion system lysozyme-like protein
MRDELVPSLWDRLFDPYRHLRGSTRYDLGTYKESLARDLEMLLNTSCGFAEAVRKLGFEQAAQSVVCFGHPGLPHAAGTNRDKLRRLEVWYAGAIQAFDARLKNVVVAIETDISPNAFAPGRTLHFKIQAELHIPPDRRTDIEFDAEVKPAELHHRIHSRS